jgi:4-azaleucine resistance transporter AzlC
MSNTPGRRAEFLAGIRAELPILVGVMPFGMVYGALALNVGMSPLAAQAMSSILFAGSAQFIMTELVGAATPAAVIILTTVIVNLRHVLYSASVAPYVRHLQPAWRWLLPYLLTDEAYAVTITHYHQGGNVAQKHWFFLGAGIALWTTWQTSTALGIFIGATIPPEWPLDFAIPLTFIALVVPVLKDRASVGAALVAGVVAVAADGLPLSLGLVVAALVGIVAGLALSWRMPHREEES